MRNFGIHGPANLWRAEGYRNTPAVPGPIEQEPPINYGLIAFFPMIALVVLLVAL